MRGCVTKFHQLLTSAPASHFVWCQLHKHGAVCACHGLQFSRPWKCSSTVPSAVPSALHEGGLRVQEHAPGSAINDSPCVREHLLHQLQGREINRRFPKVSCSIQ